MTKETYIDIYNLITEQIAKAEMSVESLLTIIDEADEPADCALDQTFRCIKRDRAKVQKYRDLLDRFEREVVEPEE